nr:ABC transporter permease [Nocardiopsis mwathae]
MHKGRLITTALAIILGVMFVSGTLVFTDTIDDTFNAKVKGSTDRIDAAVLIDWDTAAPEPDDEQEWQEPTLTPGMLAAARDLPEVAEADGLIRGDAPLLDKDGRIVGWGTAGISVGDDLATRHTAAEGRLPTADDEVAIGNTSATATGYGPGDTVTILDSDGDPRDFTVVGIIDLGVDQDLAMQGAVGFTPATTTRMTGSSDFTEIDVIGADGTTPDEVKQALDTALGAPAKVMTGQELGDAMAEGAGGGQVKLLGTALLLFAAVAMFVAGIVIYNTFAILIAQRQRETALLRCVGAHRGQVFGQVLTEAAVVGALSSLIGIAAGYLLATAGITAVGSLAPALLDGVTVSGLPTLSPTTVIAGLLVGTAVTVVSALLPAWRATAIPPLAALRSGAVAAGMEEGSGWKRAAASAVFFLAAAAMVAYAVRGEADDTGMILVAAAGMVCFVGVVTIGPLLVRAVVGLVGAPMRKIGVPSMLAADNARRSPKRAATAMIALTVGATLMTGYAVINSSMEATLDDQLGLKFSVDYEVMRQPIGGLGAAADEEDADTGVPPEITRKLDALPQIDGTFPRRQAEATLDGPEEEFSTPVVGYIGAEVGTDVRQKVVAGDLSQVGPGKIAVHLGLTDWLGLEVGDTITLPTERGERSYEIAAIPDGDGPLWGIVLDDTDFAAAFPGSTTDDAVLVKAADGEELANVREAILGAISADPTLVLGGAAEMKEQYSGIMNGVFWTVAALLGLAIIIAVFGIANTMALSVLERTRESALLRALGLTRAQLRRMLSIEAVLVSLIGTALGVALGVVFGWAAAAATFDHLILRVPTGLITVFLAAAVIAGLLAAVLPARKAARTSIAGLGSGEVG